jgi:ligand-binding sensor domain-containing protein
MKFLLPALLSLLFVITCNGNSNAQSKQSHEGQSKMRKTQGANEYQNVHCGLQDRAGNLWFGTTGEGVYRYDGKRFTQFAVKDGLRSNIIWAILEDKKGDIWLGTDAGAYRYGGKAFNYIPFVTTGNNSLFEPNFSRNNPSGKNAVWSIMQDKSGTIWFGADDGLYCYNGKDFIRFLDNPGIVNKSGLTLKSTQCMLQDKKGNIWFGSGPMAFEGICRYDGKAVEQFKPGNENWIRGITEEKGGDILFTTRHNGICRYDGKTFAYIFEPKGMVKEFIMSYLEDRSGNKWFGSDYGNELNDTVGGAWRYDGKTYTKYSTKEGLTNNSVFLIMEDRSGNIWVGTRNIGLYRFNGRTFTSFSE